MSGSAFDRLPAELIISVLGELRSPVDMYASVRISRSWYAVWRSNKLYIVRSVSRKLFPADACVYAALSLKARPQGCPVPVPNPPQPLGNRDVWYRGFVGQLDLSSCFALCQLWIVVGKIVNEYARLTLLDWPLKEILEWLEKPMLTRNLRAEKLSRELTTREKLFHQRSPYMQWLRRRWEANSIIANWDCKRGFHAIGARTCVSKMWERRYNQLRRRLLEEIESGLPKGKTTSPSEKTPEPRCSELSDQIDVP